MFVIGRDYLFKGTATALFVSHEINGQERKLSRVRGKAARKGLIFLGRRSGKTGQKVKRPVLSRRALCLFVWLSGYRPARNVRRGAEADFKIGTLNCP